MNSKIKFGYIAKNLDVHGISAIIVNMCESLSNYKYEIAVFTGTPISNIFDKHYTPVS